MKTSCRQNMRHLLLKADTAPTRFWVALASAGFSAEQVVDVTGISARLMQMFAPSWVWSALFAIHACALAYGIVTARFSKPLLFSEGILGAALWWGAALCHAVAYSSPDASIAGALIATWLLVRYPTHWECTDGG